MASSLALALLSHSPLLPQESPLPSATFLAPTLHMLGHRLGPDEVGLYAHVSGEWGGGGLGAPSVERRRLMRV